MKSLSLENLKKIYSNGTVALKGISLNVEVGDFFALLGPNGAGKSTTIGIICSLVNKSSGTVKVFDYDTDTHYSEAKSCIGVVPQEFNFNVFETLMHILMNQAGFYGINRKLAKQRAEFYLSKLGLWEKRNERARMLSGGMKRRFMIARALLHEPKLLILDEPTAGVDIESRQSMWEFMREINRTGTTIILTTHYLEEAEQLCKNIAIIDHGEIITHSSMKELLKTLHTETFILDLKHPTYISPQINGYRCELTDESTLMVELDKSQTLNDLLSELTKRNIEVTSMRTRRGRLEELFIHLVNAGTSKA